MIERRREGRRSRHVQEKKEAEEEEIRYKLNASTGTAKQEKFSENVYNGTKER